MLFKILLAQVFWHWAVFADGPDIGTPRLPYDASLPL